MRVLVDTNVVLDLLLEREPWVAEAREIARVAARGQLQLHICASSITDIFDIARRLVGAETARQVVRACLDQFQVIGVTGDLLDAAERRNGADFEDDLQVACAVAARLDAIITRDPRGFATSPIMVLSPSEWLSNLSDPETR